MDKVIFEVFRFIPEENKSPYFERFEVPYTKGMTVLQGLLYIQSKLDGSLGCRFACRAGICGSCAMHINGVYRLACETQISLLGEIVRVRPLGHLPIIKDLVVDMTEFWNKYKQIKPYLIHSSSLPEREFLQSVDDREKLTKIVDCILCGACYAACPVVGTHKDYIGPHAFTKANRFIRDSRDNGTLERLRIVGGEDGIFRCHTVFSCQEVCPKDIDPSGSISELKMLTTRLAFTSFDKSKIKV
ncbi:MAG: succinate dehydrogenase/fumarate reductase iron-sulfur subunit [Deltaproteobacteria bacterium]|nr:succinate dehydrogenase/fumarate reductase iron-sulfur subunit [Deltaproteobacteria bacterium]